MVARSIANTEFHSSGADIDSLSETLRERVGRSIVETLTKIGIRALNPSVAFPQEMDRFPGKVWIVSYKPVAVAAGLGQMGLHRNVIHPKFGNFISLGAVLMEAETIYVIPGSDAEKYTARRFPHKRVKLVSSGIRPQSLAQPTFR
jgi:hypothetical protein